MRSRRFNELHPYSVSSFSVFRRMARFPASSNANPTTLPMAAVQKRSEGKPELWLVLRMLERIQFDLTSLEGSHVLPNSSPNTTAQHLHRLIKWAVNRDSAPRRARRWHVQSDVGKLCSGQGTRSGLNDGHGVEVQGHRTNQDRFQISLSVHSRD